MKKYFFVLFILVSLVAASFAGTVKAKALFKDLKTSDPTYPYVFKMVTSYEAIAGYPNGTFRGKNTISRAELSKVIGSAFAYLEKQQGVPLGEDAGSSEVVFKDLPKNHWAYSFVADLVKRYQVISGYPDGSFRPLQTIKRYELATILSKVMKRVYARYELDLPSAEAVALKDVKKNHWAMRDIQLLLAMNIMQSQKDKKKNQLFAGAQAVNRFGVAVSVARLIDRANTLAATLPPGRLAELKAKYGPKKVIAAPVSPIMQKEVVVANNPTASISAGFGNIYEPASGTNNWRNFSAAVTYGNAFKLGRIAGNYELAARYANNQVVYLVPSGGGINTTLNIENRSELELNTTYPLVQFWGISGKLLLGAKYISLSNPSAPTNFTGFNAGLVTSANLLRRNVLLKAFYSLPLSRAQVSPSVLGQPAQLFDYEASIDAVFFGFPLLIGFSGETMTNTGSGQRFYNNIFIRYFLF